jgi:hypothetical protein
MFILHTENVTSKTLSTRRAITLELHYEQTTFPSGEEKIAPISHVA